MKRPAGARGFHEARRQPEGRSEEAFCPIIVEFCPKGAAFCIVFRRPSIETNRIAAVAFVLRRVHVHIPIWQRASSWSAEGMPPGRSLPPVGHLPLKRLAASMQGNKFPENLLANIAPAEPIGHLRLG